MNCRYCGVDMRLYTVNNSGGYECMHAGPAPEHIVATLYAKPNEDLVALIARLGRVVEELERRAYGSATYRTPG